MEMGDELPKSHFSFWKAIYGHLRIRKRSERGEEAGGRPLGLILLKK
jgi:hypothetical protein